MRVFSILLASFCFSLSAASAGLGSNPFGNSSPTSATNPGNARPSGPSQSPPPPPVKQAPIVPPPQSKPEAPLNKPSQQNKK